MKSIPALITATLFSFYLTAQPIQLIVRGDDMGFSHSGNVALIKAFTEGIESSIEVIVPSPWFPEAAKMLNEHRGIDVGIHLALTSEWDNIKWRPLAQVPGLTDPDGYFFPMIYPNANYPGLAILQNKWKLEDIEKEFRAQIELALKKIPHISHISSHMGCTSISKEVSAMTKRLAKEYKLDIDPAEYQVTGVGYDGAHRTLEEKKKSFASMLNKLEKGKTYLFVDHPGLDGEELRAIHHIGYTNVSADRQGVTDLWTDPAINALIAERGIRLIGYKDLKK